MFEATTLEAVRDILPGARNFSVKQNTILSALNQPLGLPAVVDGTPDESVLTLIAERARSQDEEPSHTYSMSQAVQVAANSVRQTLHLVRNVVNPHLREVVQRYDAHMAGFEQAACSPYTIVQVCTPDLFKDPIIDDILQANASRLRTAPIAEPVVIGNYDRESIMRMLVLTEERDINAQLREILTDNGSVGVSKVLAVLSGQEPVADILRHRPYLALPLYIILNAIEMPTEGVRTTATVWELNRRRLIASCIYGIEQVRGRLANILKYNVLYDVNTPSKPFEIRVNGEVYVSMLESGFSANALIGHEVLKRPYKTNAEIMEKSKILEEAYGREQLQLQAAYQIKQRTQQLGAVIKAIREDAEARIAEGKFVVEGDTAEKARGRVVTVLERLTTGTHRQSDPILLSMAAVLGIWYAHTDASRYCDYVIEVEVENPALKGRSMEIHMLATVRYVVAFGVSMLDLK